MHRSSVFAGGLLLAALLLTAPPAFAVLQKGEPAPPIKVSTTAGQPVTLANYKGYVLILDFFATWCPPCKESIPHLVELNRKYGKQGLQTLGMSVDDSAQALKEFANAKKLNYPLAPVDEELQTEYGLRSIPTIFIINKKGIVAEKYMGFSADTGRKMEEAIKRLLAE
jgi:peroxiredoxin